MKNPATTECRSHIIPRSTGRVLDVGIGSGLNLRFYGPCVTRLWGIDPSSELLGMARPKPKSVPFPVELLTRYAEEIPFPQGSIDTTVRAVKVFPVIHHAAGDRGQNLKERQFCSAHYGFLLIVYIGTL